MLTELSIRDIVLIDKLSLSFTDGLNVLTGETGAGKSILLDSLGLALGARADRALVRSGAEKGVVSANFSVPVGHSVLKLLQGLAIDDVGGEVRMKRQVTGDGRSRGWINDEPVGQAVMASVATALIEIHGQHDDRGLLEAAAHRQLLDEFAEAMPLRSKVSKTHSDYRDAVAEQQRIQQLVDALSREEEYVRHAVAELDTLSPEIGEDATLADKRSLMMQGEQAAKELIEFQDILGSGEGVDATVRGVLRRLARLGDTLAAKLAPVATALDKAAEELSIANDELYRIHGELAFNPSEQEQVEERLFEIRRLARKHKCQPDDLATVAAQLSEKLAHIDSGAELLSAAAKGVAATREHYGAAVKKLSAARMKASTALDRLVNAELAPLKLEKATFRTSLKTLDELDWGEFGAERIVFEVKTNAGSEFGPLVKVASGGELARFILALKVVLSSKSAPLVMVFDEVDRGIGGATASAVGERLKRLSQRSQLLVVTHSPQVAARGDTQYQISKEEVGGGTLTSVVELAPTDRTEEIARMLAGATVTDAARAAATQLLAAKET